MTPPDAQASEGAVGEVAAPSWAVIEAFRRASDEAGYPLIGTWESAGPFGRVLARYIAAHEPAPVDPLRGIVTEIAQAILSDAFLDDDAAIEHAIEVARAIIPEDAQAILRARLPAAAVAAVDGEV